MEFCVAKYAIGDIQGCYDELISLLNTINFNPGVDTLYLVGDLVNRGPKSLEVLQFIHKHSNCVQTVLGNHDIYLLARHSGVIPAAHDDTLADVLKDPNINQLVDLLRSFNLIIQEQDFILVHAGIYPQMDYYYLIELNNEIATNLQAKSYAEFLSQIYGNKPNLWEDKSSLIKQMKFVINASTRMRYLQLPDYALDYKCSQKPGGQIENLVPWFEVEPQTQQKKKIIFGHWASLGLYQGERAIGLDTGCVWGNQLTAINLDSLEIYQIEAKNLKADQ